MTELKRKVKDAYISTGCVVTNSDASLSQGVIDCEAIWDTGTTITNVSKRVADSLNLPIVGKQAVQTIGGIVFADETRVDIALPSGLLVPNCPAIIVADLSKCDVLIGLNIIRLGDFVLSNINGQTTFCFRTPTQGVEGCTIQAPPKRKGWWARLLGR